jgi:hypothetical protein
MVTIQIEAADEGDLFSPLTGSIFGVNEVRLNKMTISAASESVSFYTNLIEWLVALTGLIRAASEEGRSEAKTSLLFAGDVFRGYACRDREGTLRIFDSFARADVTVALSWSEMLKLHQHVYEYIDQIAGEGGSSLKRLKDSHLISLP